MSRIKQQGRKLGELRGREQVRKCLLIVCEGSETEVNYFKAFKRELRLSSLKIEVFGAGGGDIKVINYALTLQERPETAEFDEIWVVFDKEGENKKSSFEKAIQLANKEGFKLAVSEPSFEYWYLLHHTLTTQPFANASAVIVTLKRYIPNYQKEDKNIFNSLHNDTLKAIGNAKNVLTRHESHGHMRATFPNPSTTVHELVETLETMKRT